MDILMLSWISTRLHQETGRFGAAWLGKVELTDLTWKRPDQCFSPEFSKVQKTTGQSLNREGFSNLTPGLTIAYILDMFSYVQTVACQDMSSCISDIVHNFSQIFCRYLQQTLNWRIWRCWGWCSFCWVQLQLQPDSELPISAFMALNMCSS